MNQKTKSIVLLSVTVMTLFSVLVISCTSEAVWRPTLSDTRVSVTVDQTTDEELIASFSFLPESFIEVSDYSRNWFETQKGDNEGAMAIMVNNTQLNLAFLAVVGGQFTDQTADGGIALTLTYDIENFLSGDYLIDLTIDYRPDDPVNGYQITSHGSKFDTDTIKPQPGGSFLVVSIPNALPAIRVDADGTSDVILRDLSMIAFVLVAADSDDVFVTSTIPSAGLVDVTADDPITVSFGSFIDTATPVMDTSIKDLYVDNVLVDPTDVTWISSSELQYVPPSALPSGKQIFVDVPETHRLQSGDTIPFPFTFSFTTRE
jgi:hypothetical protein